MAAQESKSTAGAGSAGMVALLCAAEVLALIGVFAFPALLPVFFKTWNLTSTEAGWISGIYFAGYAASVPFLSALTDRIDARWVFAGGATIGGLAALGFALWAEGFWTAFLFRILAGIGLAGAYMPGLRALVDRFRGRHESRAVAFYISSFSLGTATSFLVNGQVESAFGWQAAFVVSGLCGILGAVLALARLKPVAPHVAAEPTAVFDFRPVFRNRPAMGYILAYGAHCWELFVLRSWIVAFLTFSLTLQPAGHDGVAPTVIATFSGLMAMVASFIGQEVALKIGKRLLVVVTMLVSGAVAGAVGFMADLPYAWVVTLVLVHSATVQFDSSVLNAGSVETAEVGRRGATLAIHSLVGFGAAFLGPLVVGVALDLAGGASSISAWGIAYLSVAAVCLLGPLAMAWSVRGPSPADGRPGKPW